MNRPLTNYPAFGLDTVWQMLTHVPSDDRDTWIKLGMAIKSEFGDEGFSIWCEWSESAPNYQARAAKDAWKSFKGSGVGIGSLVHVATGHGWRKGVKPPATKPKLVRIAPGPSKDTSKYAKELFLRSNRDDLFVAAHTYAERKGITGAGGGGRTNATGKLIGHNADCIIVPIRDIETDRVQGVEAIDGEGKKQSFGNKTGGALILGNSLQKTEPWYILEGWASAYSTVFHHGKQTAVCAFGKGSQDKVAIEIARVYDPNEIIILREVD